MSKKSRARKAAHYSERRIAIVTEGREPDIITLDRDTPAKSVILCFDNTTQLQRARVALYAAMQEMSHLPDSEREQLIDEFYEEDE